MATTVTVEREIKLAADVALVLPDLTNVLPGVTVGPVSRRQLSAVYYDTPTLSLARSGVTLRARTGEPGPVWTLKLPAPPAGSALSRHEITFDAPLGPVPLAARQAVLAHTRSQRLDPVVRLHTDRSQFMLELGGRPLALVCDDVVVPDGGTEPVGAFREIEIELASDEVSRKAIGAVAACLRAAGCQSGEAPVPKAIRALGRRAVDPPDVRLDPIGKRSNALDLVRHTIAGSVIQLIDHHAGTWIGEDPEELHRFRVAARRLRSDLRTFAPLLDHGWTVWLRDELAWLGGEVGVGRDADVLAGRLRSQAARLPAEDAGALDRLLERLGEAKTEARQRVLDTLSSERYLALLDALVDAAGDPLLASEPADLADADRAIVIDLVRKPWRRLSRAVQAVAPDAPDTAMHAIRIRSKHARYAADAVAPLFGRDARRLAGALADVQSVLGDYQDTTVAEAWLREAAKVLPSVRLVAGELIAFERNDRQRLRKKFVTVWKRASRPTLRKWMT